MFDQMRLLLLQSEQAYDVCVELMSKSCRHQVDGAQCDYRMKQINKAIEVELVQQQKYLEGTRFTTFLASKAKELYKKLYTNMEESMRSRREMCERTKMSSQEQLYSMAENLHDVITKRMSQDNLQIRTDQGQLDTANRSLMGLVHVPNEMEKQMDIIRRLTLDISSAKHRMNQSQADIGTIRQILTKYGTLQFLKRDSNFLSVFDGVERQAKLKERLDDVVLKVKFVSEVLVEIADPETRQDYVVQQALEALKTSVTDLNELLPQKSKMEDLDEQFRVNTATRLKRHKRLLAHFLDEIREGTNDLSTKEPAVEVHCVAMMDNLQVVLSALTHNEEPVPPHLRTAYLQGASSGQAPQQSYYDSAGGVGGGGIANGGGGPGGDMGGQKFGGGVGGGGRSLASSETHGAFDTASAEQIRHTFARYSERLKVSQESTRLTKISGGMEMSNTSALGAVGFRLNSGIHFFAIRIGANCSRLLVGFADWNLPLDGYCNSIKYPACYYLHIGNGTLWAPDQKVERKAYTYESIGSSVGGVLQCIVNTNDRSISYIFNEMNLGIAFRNVNLSRTLYPAFEVFSNNCTVEFTMLAQNGAKKE
ncbi:unnamed protein product [Bodo saltans]|uniref:B30.2/SPRY domain-containing protein n=1 Tax=Bodo saltans TaxID=75058 RepID=A0A0S4JPD2_BODSA|nr:unnamed protein product [Bodo saltans]|eukprot:CUG92157.1 unnamed protein product [Bodo saltans]